MDGLRQQFLLLNVWARGLILTFGLCLALFAVGLAMGKLRHLVIEGALRRLLGARAAIFVGYYLTIIGTLHHELAHALGYLLTGGQVHRISILPKAQPDGSIRLGYVIGSSRGPWLLRAIQDTVSATAPLSLGFLTIYLLVRFALPRASGAAITAFLYYILVSIALHMELSREDLKTLARGLFPVLLLLYAAVMAALLFRG